MLQLNCLMCEMKIHASCTICLISAYIPRIDMECFSLIRNYHFHFRLLEIFNIIEKAFDTIHKYKKRDLAFIFVLNNVVDLPLIIFMKLGSKFTSICNQTLTHLCSTGSPHRVIAESVVKKFLHKSSKYKEISSSHF